MKKCSNCGAQLPDDELFCPHCGEEVQLVPIFETVESSIKEQQRILEEKERERQAILEMEEEEREKAARKRNLILITTGVAAFIVVAFISLSFILNTSRKSSFNGKYTKAVEAYNSGDYDSSLELITVALEKDPGNLEGKILMADIYAAQGKTDMSASIYQEVIDENPDSESAYKKLIGMYEVLGQGSNIRALLNRCTSESIKTKFAEYICSTPELSLEAGKYDSIQSVALSNAEGHQIRYTLDGTDPSLLSLSYNEPIELTGGTNTVRAVCYNEKGVPSDIVEAVYEIDAEYVDPPVIFPRSTTFTFTDGKTHKFTVIVPKGTKAVYSFDTMPTVNSTAYTGPVDMLNGTHVFYAILIDKKTGMVSSPTSISYTLSESEVQESVSVVQDSDGNVNASYSDGSDYVPYTPDTGYVDPPYSGGGDSGGGSSGGGGVAPAPSGGGDSGGGSSGGGEVAPTPGGGGESGGGESGGGEVTPTPGGGESGGGESGGGEVTPEPGGGGESGGGESGGGESGGGESGGGESGGGESGGESGGGESGGGESGGGEASASEEIAPVSLTEDAAASVE